MMNKKLLCIFAVVFSLIVLIGLSTNVSNRTAIAAQNISGISLQNTTPFSLENITLTFNADVSGKTMDLSSNETVKVPIPAEKLHASYITSISISGQATSGKGFANTFTGLAGKQTCLTIYLDKDMNMCTSSNME